MAGPAVIATVLMLASLTTAPGQLQVSTAQGIKRVDLVQWAGDGPLIPLGPLARALSGKVSTEGDWFVLDTPGGHFRFLPESPLVHDGNHLRGLPATAHRRGDSLFVPLAFVAEVLADPARKAWSWTPGTMMLAQRAATTSPGVPPAPRSVGTGSRSLLANGLKTGHHVTLDAGHGGTDPGNPGLYLPRGVHEKDVTLAVALKVRTELERRGVKVTMTRSTDTLINLGERAPRFCRSECDLFVSIHANSLDRRPGYTAVRGFETYILGEAQTSDAARVAKMENEAIRYNTASEDVDLSDLEYMLKDMQSNEFLRASAQAAEYMQTMLLRVESGPDKGVKSAGFAVLRTARRPAILVEMGYATNPTDGRMMSSSSGQQQLAEAIAGAIVNYLQWYDRLTADSSGDGSPMRRRILVAVLLLAGCTWSNALYRARSLSGEAARADRGGRPGEAQNLWSQAAVKAESALARSPRGRHGAEARWLLGRALGRAHDCDRGRPYLENALADAPGAKWDGALQLELARCVELVDTVRAAGLFAALAQSKDAATRLEAREGAGRDLVASGEPEAALAILTGVESSAARLDRAVALAMLGRSDSAFAEVRLVLETPTASVEWDHLIAALAGGSSDAADRLLVLLAAKPGQSPQNINDWRLAALRGTRQNDDEAFQRRYALLLSGKPGAALARGRVLAAERLVSQVATTSELTAVRDSLSKAPAPTGDFVATRQWAHLQFLLGRMAEDSTVAEVGGPHGDLLTFAHAELARDSLHAPQLSAALFANVERRWPASPYVPKSMFARIWLQPDSADALRARAAAYQGSPYLAYLKGLDDSMYRHLEDSLAGFVSALAAKAAADSKATGVIR